MAPACGGTPSDPLDPVSFLQFHIQTLLLPNPDLLCVRCFASAHGAQHKERAIGSVLMFQGERYYINLGKIRKGSWKEVAFEMSRAEQDGLWPAPV